jgi:hypothetical protein
MPSVTGLTFYTKVVLITITLFGDALPIHATYDVLDSTPVAKFDGLILIWDSNCTTTQN